MFEIFINLVIYTILSNAVIVDNQVFDYVRYIEVSTVFNNALGASLDSSNIKQLSPLKDIDELINPIKQGAERVFNEKTSEVKAEVKKSAEGIVSKYLNELKMKIRSQFDKLKNDALNIAGNWLEIIRNKLREIFKIK